MHGLGTRRAPSSPPGAWSARQDMIRLISSIGFLKIGLWSPTDRQTPGSTWPRAAFKARPPALSMSLADLFA